MNKILLDKEKKVELEVIEDSICNINKNIELEELNIILKNNAKFIINHYSEIKENKTNINIYQYDNSEFIYNHSFKNKGLYNLQISIYMKGNKSKNTINIKGISDDAKTCIIVNGSVDESTFDNELNEKIKMINMNNGESIIEPNMFIDTRNILANHSASITNFDEDYLFYLNSKGINNEEAKKLIINGFLNNDAK